MAALLTVTFLCFTLLFKVHAVTNVNPVSAMLPLSNMFPGILTNAFIPVENEFEPSIHVGDGGKFTSDGCSPTRRAIENYVGLLLGAPWIPQLSLRACYSTPVQFGQAKSFPTDCQINKLGVTKAVVPRPSSNCELSWGEPTLIGCSTEKDQVAIGVYQLKLKTAGDQPASLSKCADTPGSVHGMNFFFPDQLFTDTFVTIFSDRTSVESVFRVVARRSPFLFDTRFANLMHAGMNGCIRDPLDPSKGVLGRLRIPTGCCVDPRKSSTKRQMTGTTEQLASCAYDYCCEHGPDPTPEEVSTATIILRLRGGKSPILVGQMVRSWSRSHRRIIQPSASEQRFSGSNMYYVYGPPTSRTEDRDLVVYDHRKAKLSGTNRISFGGSRTYLLSQTAKIRVILVPITNLRENVEGIREVSTPFSARIQPAEQNSLRGGYVTWSLSISNRRTMYLIEDVPPDRVVVVGFKHGIKGNQLKHPKMYVALLSSKDWRSGEGFGDLARATQGVNNALEDMGLFVGGDFDPKVDHMIPISFSNLVNRYPKIILEPEAMDLNLSTSMIPHKPFTAMIFTQGTDAWIICQILSEDRTSVEHSFEYHFSELSGIPPMYLKIP